ncbi:MAG TPA: hypothetical protein VD970_05770 [Acetobacteraceae bacterium]|nr:hypothetical protein [Acetobacteraceae bacterium]
MARPARPFTLLALLPLALLACAPQAANTTVTPYNLGTAGYVTYGTILAMTPVQMTGTRSGLGTGAGVVGGSLIGGTIGGDWRARAVGAVAGAVIGGLAGTAVEEGVTSGQAVQYLIRQDSGADIQVVQTNELGFRPGDRVAISQGDRVRLARADHVPPPPPPPPTRTARRGAGK